jgi:uncharacterized protein YneF (UPF0154 family)
MEPVINDVNCIEPWAVALMSVVFLILGTVWGFYICTQIEHKFINKNIKTDKNGNKK